MAARWTGAGAQGAGCGDTRLLIAVPRRIVVNRAQFTAVDDQRSRNR